MQHAARLFTVLGERGAQGGVTRLQVAEAAQQGFAVQHTLEAQGCREVVGGAVRVQLPENPLPLLGKRQHARLPCWQCTQQRLADAVRLRRAAGSEVTEHAAFKQTAEGQFDVQLLTHARHHLRHQQRMPAQFKEVIVPAHGVQFEHVLPDRGHVRLDPGLGCHHFTLPVGGLRLRQCLAVDLAIGIERQLIEAQPLQRHHVFRQLRLESGFEVFTQGVPVRRVIVGHDKGHQCLADRAFLHHHGGFAHAIEVTQARFDFTQFNAETAHFDLLVDAAHVL